MWLAIFGLVCFWSGIAAVIAELCGWPVIPLVVVIGIFAAVILIFAGALCRAAGTELPGDDGPIELQTYFGGTFRMRSSGGGVRLIR